MIGNSDLLKLLKQLDWDESIDIQTNAIEILSHVNDLKIFMQPDDKDLGFKVWENCAVILAKKTNEELLPYLKDLFRWLMDEDTPGFFLIYERMEDFNYGEVEEIYNTCIIEAKNEKNYEWLDILTHLKFKDNFKNKIFSKSEEEINILFKDLDWNVNHEKQHLARQKLSKLKDLSLFMQPKGKNTWENCALILNKKTNEELLPYLKDLFSWLQDMNWPGAFIISYRLQKFSYFMVKEVYEQYLSIASKKNDEIWLDNLKHLIFRDN